MEIVATFDPTISGSGTQNFIVKNGGHVLFINESYFNLKITLQNGQNFYLPANDRRLIELKGIMSQPGTTFKYEMLTTLAKPNPNVNNVIVESYAPGEPLPEIYPSPMLRQLNAAGAVGSLDNLSLRANECIAFITARLSDIIGDNQTFQAFPSGELLLGNSNGVNGLNGTLNTIMANPTVGATGDTSGQALLYTPLGGQSCSLAASTTDQPFKLYMVKLNNFNSTVFKDIALPNVFTTWLLWFNLSGNAVAFVSSGSAQSAFIINGFFTTTSSTSVNNNAWGSLQVGSNIDAFRIGNTGGSARNGGVIFAGV